MIAAVLVSMMQANPTAYWAALSATRQYLAQHFFSSYQDLFCVHPGFIYNKCFPIGLLCQIPKIVPTHCKAEIRSLCHLFCLYISNLKYRADSNHLQPFIIFRYNVCTTLIFSNIHQSACITRKTVRGTQKLLLLRATGKSWVLTFSELGCNSVKSTSMENMPWWLETCYLFWYTSEEVQDR